MQQDQITAPVSPCPVCGAEPRYRIWSEFISGYVDIGIQGRKRWFQSAKPMPLICTACGYVQLFVNPEDFKS